VEYILFGEVILEIFAISHTRIIVYYLIKGNLCRI